LKSTNGASTSTFSAFYSFALSSNFLLTKQKHIKTLTLKSYGKTFTSSLQSISQKVSKHFPQNINLFY